MKNSDCGAVPSNPEGFPEEFGLTKREYFAARLMQGLCGHAADYGTFEEMANDAVNAADALLKRLEE